MIVKPQQKIEKILADITIEGQAIWQMMRLQHVSLQEGKLFLIIESEEKQPEGLEKMIKDRVKTIDGVETVSVLFTSDKKAPDIKKTPPVKPILPKNIKAVLGVASAKGGVGKSTIAANLALALSQQKKRIGLLDADIHGPSQHVLFGIDHERSRELAPVYAHNVAVMSMGRMIERDTPVIWRGPMIGKALQQMCLEVEWGELDILVIDFPPGTGDVPLSLSRLLPLSGVILVSTPQKLAIEDTRRGLIMFRKMEASILGIIENMSGFLCPHCNEITDIFEGEALQETAEQLDTRILGKIPLSPALIQGSDIFMASSADSAIGSIFSDIAKYILNDKAFKEV